MSDPIKILTYLKENSADPDTRKALTLAINAINSKEYSTKSVELKKAIDSIERSNVEEYMRELDRVCTQFNIDPALLEYLPMTFNELLTKLAKGEVYVKGDHTAFLIDNKVLNYPVHVCQDDGMGYGAFTTYAFDGYVDDKDIKIWT